MNKILLPFFIFIIVASTVLFYQHQTKRSPSSLALDPSGILQLQSPEAYTNETKKQIKRSVLHSLDWNVGTSDSGVQQLSVKYENLKIDGEAGHTDLCTVYPTVLLVLEAPQVSYSGEHPELMIYGTCQNQITIGKINFLFESSKLPLRAWDEFPDTWRVKHLIFSDASKSQSKNIDLNQYEILSILGYSIEFPINLKKQ